MVDPLGAVGFNLPALNSLPAKPMMHLCALIPSYHGAHFYGIGPDKLAFVAHDPLTRLRANH